jgi:hypothetical protein
MVRPSGEMIPGAATGYESSWPRRHDKDDLDQDDAAGADGPSRDGTFQSV